VYTNTKLVNDQKPRELSPHFYIQSIDNIYCQLNGVSPAAIEAVCADFED